MAVYTSLRATAQRLIQKNGRSITYRQAGTTLVDAGNPQLGTTGPVDTIAKMAFITDTISRRTQTIVQAGNRVGLIAADDLPGIIPKVNDIVIDSNIQWSVLDIESIDPSEAPIVHQLILGT